MMIKKEDFEEAAQGVLEGWEADRKAQGFEVFGEKEENSILVFGINPHGNGEEEKTEKHTQSFSVLLLREHLIFFQNTDL